MAERSNNLISDAHERACDGCPFRDECRDYKNAFGPEGCFRDEWAKSLMDYLRHSGQEEEECFKLSD